MDPPAVFFAGSFEEVYIATILREVLKGLEYLHGENTLHRDVKVRIKVMLGLITRKKVTLLGLLHMRKKIKRNNQHSPVLDIMYSCNS